MVYNSRPLPRLGGTPGGTAPRARTPIWLCLVIAGLAAWVYLGQTDRASAANAQLQDQQQLTQQLIVQRQLALANLGRVSAPAYVLAQAQALGMVPADWGDNASAGGRP
jgi:hypothetical protein